MKSMRSMRLTDVDTRNSKTIRDTIWSDSSGRIKITMNGSKA
jgi:hypothetical protein